jgi:hypothetical protein
MATARLFVKDWVACRPCPAGVERLPEADRRRIAGPGTPVAIGDAHRNHRDRSPLIGEEQGQPGHALLELDFPVLLADPSFGKQDQLLTIGQQVDRVPQAGQAGASLVHREAAEAIEQPTLQALHLINGDHEAAVAAGDPTASPIGKEEGIPAGTMGGSQQHRTGGGEILPAQSPDAAEERRQGNVFGGQDGEWREPGADAGTDRPFPLNDRHPRFRSLDVGRRGREHVGTDPTWIAS